jgi:energy-coupling factor transporter transmembrane protein EcfT
MAAYRTVPILGERLETIVAAQRARGAPWKTANPIRLATLVLSLGVPAVYAATDVALSLADSLYIRGYRLERRITMAPTPLLEWGDVLVVVLAAAVTLAGGVKAG